MTRLSTSATAHTFPRRPALMALAISALLLLALAGPASASRAPTQAESKAIKKAFFKNHLKATTKISRIRVSTVNKAYAAVVYRTDIPAPQRPAAAKVYKPIPEVLKKGKGGKWKGPVKPPKKVKDDLKAKSARSEIRISGDVNVTLTRAAQCTPGSGSASIYDPASDIYLSIQFHQDAYTGPGKYPALSVRSLAGIYVNSATELRWETGQSSDAFAPSGEIYVDGGGWGIIEASMARVNDGTDTFAPQSVVVSGTWACS